MDKITSKMIEKSEKYWINFSKDMRNNYLTFLPSSKSFYFAFYWAVLFGKFKQLFNLFIKYYNFKAFITLLKSDFTISINTFSIYLTVFTVILNLSFTFWTSIIIYLNNWFHFSFNYWKNLALWNSHRF